MATAALVIAQVLRLLVLLEVHDSVVALQVGRPTGPLVAPGIVAEVFCFLRWRPGRTENKISGWARAGRCAGSAKTYLAGASL
jgi:hypothetical protein